jgi:hexosaminidase
MVLARKTVNKVSIMKFTLKYISLFVIIVLLPRHSFSQTLCIIPQPQQVQLKNGSFLLDSKVVVEIVPSADKALADIANQFVQQLANAGGPKLQLSQGKMAPLVRYIRFTIHENKSANTESYKLRVTPAGIDIVAPTYNGCFYGLQTLLQLLPDDVFSQLPITRSSWEVQCMNITDYPRFPYRGMHLDVSRHFYPVSFIKKFIDLMAIHKLNTFHWHLTDDQGWRIEIKKYPNLTNIGSKRKNTIKEPYQRNSDEPHEGFYTQEEIREVVAYAGKRYITIIPEIETPSHAMAALASYPELGCKGKGYEVSTKMGVMFEDDNFCVGKENTFAFLESVLDEVMELFPGKYIHIGGDECPTAVWKSCPYCQARIRNEKLKNESELQGYFLKRIEKYVSDKGRRIIGWDEILEEGISANTTIMSWRGNQGAITAARTHHDVIMAPTTPLYFIVDQGCSNTDSISMSFINGYNTLDSVYCYEPVPVGLSKAEEKFIIGLQACTWTEFMGKSEVVESMVYPRICALSEVQWLDNSRKDLHDFKSRLQMHFRRLSNLNVNYAKHPL